MGIDRKPSSISFRVRVHHQFQLEAYTGLVRVLPVGRLSAVPYRGGIRLLRLEVNRRHRRKGVATAMLAEAYRQLEPARVCIDVPGREFVACKFLAARGYTVERIGDGSGPGGDDLYRFVIERAKEPG
jgi:GNAT superfamily N-acetyltransferase